MRRAIWCFRPEISTLLNCDGIVTTWITKVPNSDIGICLGDSVDRVAPYESRVDLIFTRIEVCRSIVSRKRDRRIVVLFLPEVADVRTGVIKGVRIVVDQVAATAQVHNTKRVIQMDVVVVELRPNGGSLVVVVTSPIALAPVTIYRTFDRICVGVRVYCRVPDNTASTVLMIKHPRGIWGTKRVGAVKVAVLEEGEVWASSLPVLTIPGGVTKVVLPTNKVAAVGAIIERTMVNYSPGLPDPADSALSMVEYAIVDSDLCIGKAAGVGMLHQYVIGSDVVIDVNVFERESGYPDVHIGWQVSDMDKASIEPSTPRNGSRSTTCTT